MPLNGGALWEGLSLSDNLCDTLILPHTQTLNYLCLILGYAGPLGWVLEARPVLEVGAGAGLVVSVVLLPCAPIRSLAAAQLVDHNLMVSDTDLDPI